MIHPAHGSVAATRVPWPGADPIGSAPLMIADVMRGSGHFNLAQGTVGAAVGLGASFGDYALDNTKADNYRKV